MNFKHIKALSFKLVSDNISCLSLTERFMLEETKFIKKELLLIFFIANDASDGIFGFS